MARSLRPSRSNGGGLLRVAEVNGLRRGMRGSKGWFYVGTGLWTIRTLRRFAARSDELLISEELKPGQRILIANDRVTIEGGDVDQAKPKGRRARRKQAKVDAKAARKAQKKAAKRAKKAA